MGSLVSPVDTKHVMEEVEGKALITFTGIAPSHWFRHLDDTGVKIRAREVEAFAEHINAVDNNIKFTQEDVRGDGLPLLYCTVHTEEDRSLNIEVYRKPTHTDQYLLFDSHHPLEHKLGVIRTLNQRADTVPTTAEHIRGALKICGCQNL